MSKIKAVDTKPEMLVRRLIHSMGFRYRLHRKDLPGNPDLVFIKYRKVIFIHGCFWHGHECKKLPKSNVEFWSTKWEKNRNRDGLVQRQLEALGWNIMVIWECSIKEMDKLKLQILQFLNDSY